MFLKAWAHRNKGMMVLRHPCIIAQLCPGLVGSIQQLILRQVSDQRGTCLVERPARRRLVPFIRARSYSIYLHRKMTYYYVVLL